MPQCAGAVDGCMIQMPKPATRQCPPDLIAGAGYDNFKSRVRNHKTFRLSLHLWSFVTSMDAIISLWDRTRLGLHGGWCLAQIVLSWGNWVIDGEAVGIVELYVMTFPQITESTTHSTPFVPGSITTRSPPILGFNHQSLIAEAATQ
jgi:hypothetical protein